MFPIEWFQQPICRLLTLTLLHFVWQGLAIAIGLVVLVETSTQRRAAARYACSLAALVAMICSPLVTLAWLLHSQPTLSAGIETLSPGDIAFGAFTSRDWLAAAQPYCFAFWLVGVMIFGGRLLTGAAGVVRLRRGRLPLSPEVAKVVKRLGRRMRINAVPLVYFSGQIAEAMAVGLVRPLVLVPAAWATEMPLDMLEAVIAHELAHLRRYDLWINLLQRIAETLLFYHPAVWWLSRRLSIERELCADELAVAATGKRLEYAQALEQIAQERQADIRPALAAFLRGETNMRLLQRVQHVLGQRPIESSRLWPVGLLALALPLGLWAASAMTGSATADDDREERKQPAVKADDATFLRRVYLDATGTLPTPDETRAFLSSDDPKKQAKLIDQLVAQRNRADATADKRTIVVVQRRSDDRDNDDGDDDDDEKRPTVRREEKRRETGDRESGNKPRWLIEEREERTATRKPGQPVEGRIERKVISADGKPRVEVQLSRREERAAGGEQRLDELTVLVKRLSAQVERLQDEVAQLRGGKKPTGEKESSEAAEIRARKLREAADKLSSEALLEAIANKKQAAERQAREAKERAAAEAAEKKARVTRESAEADRATAEKEREAREKAEAQREKAEAAREKAEEVREAIERKLRGLKEKDKDIDIGVPNDLDKEKIKRALRDKESLLKDPEKAPPKKPIRKGDF